MSYQPRESSVLPPVFEPLMLPGLPGLELRSLEESHVPQVSALERICYPNPWSEPFVQSEFEKEISFRPAVFSGDTVAAYSFNYVVTDELHILNLAVNPDFRKLGLARRLLAAILYYAAKEGVCYAGLEVRVGNMVARRLYSEFNFAPVSVRRNYYSDNGEDALVLERVLTQFDVPLFSEVVRTGVKNTISSKV